MLNERIRWEMYPAIICGSLQQIFIANDFSKFENAYNGMNDACRSICEIREISLELLDSIVV